MKKRRTQQVADDIKTWIAHENMQPGHPLPSETEIIERFNASKSTVRESMRILEAQGLLTTKTGPKGGIFVGEMSESKAFMMLSNYFYSRDISISDLYQIRSALEPELVAMLSGTLSDTQINALHQQVEKYNKAIVTPDEDRQRHIDAIGFHSLLAEYCGNEYLKFLVRFTAEMLQHLTVRNRLYEPENQELWLTGINSDRAIIHALENNEKDKVYQLMKEHMETAHRLMKQQETKIQKSFLSE